MRKSILFCLCIAVVALFAACKDPDGVYNPSKKIQKIYTVENGEQQLQQVWQWSGNLLSSIEENYGYTTLKTTFTYDSKNRLSTIESMGSRGEVSYDGNKLDDIKFYYGSEEIAKYDFDYKGGKISEIEMEIYDLWDKSAANPLRYLLPEVYPVVSDFVQNRQSDIKGDKIKMKLYWKGNNVKTIELTETGDITYSSTTDCLFDNKSNPFYGCVSEMGSDIIGNFFLNKNNIVTMTTLAGGSTSEVKNTYEYDGNYPVKVTSKTTDWEGTETSTVIYEYE